MYLLDQQYVVPKLPVAAAMVTGFAHAVLDWTAPVVVYQQRQLQYPLVQMAGTGTVTEELMACSLGYFLHNSP